MRCLGGEIQARLVALERRAEGAPRRPRLPRPVEDLPAPRTWRPATRSCSPAPASPTASCCAACASSAAAARTHDALHVAVAPDHPLRRHDPSRGPRDAGLLRPDGRTSERDDQARPLDPRLGRGRAASTRTTRRRSTRRRYDVRVSDHWICPTRDPEEFTLAARSSCSPARSCSPRRSSTCASRARRLRPEAQVDARPAVDQPLARRLVRSRASRATSPSSCRTSARRRSCSTPAGGSPS